ncbi:hypothetical protein [Agarilytica rhodophyticola]|uniref:hypothetical protein n=1 Tax=Agarilytica rhodophyticola TaxID=1737490 RepID=UPI000B344934|nr:hypothetical protein [Agarilytica rhodophyticola]
MLPRFFALSMCIALAGCEITPEVQDLMDKNSTLETQLKEANQQISSLESEQTILAADNTELKRVMAILDTEKSSRVQESSGLRMQIRKFTQKQIDQLKEFLVLSDLLDYVGEELFDRTKIDATAAVLVDLANPIPRRGTLIGVSGHFSRSTDFSIHILRPVGNRYVVIWQSPSVTAKGEGFERFRFPLSVGIEKGDVIAYDFPATVGVKYDNGTGQTLLSKKSFMLGASVAVSSLKYASDKRAYSLGVSAILE